MAEPNKSSRTSEKRRTSADASPQLLPSQEHDSYPHVHSHQTPPSSPLLARIIRGIVAQVDRKKQLEIEQTAKLTSKD